MKLTKQVGARLDLPTGGVTQHVTTAMFLRLYSLFMENLIRKSNSAQHDRQQTELTIGDVLSAIKSYDSLGFLNDFVVEVANQSNGITVSKVS